MLQFAGVVAFALLTAIAAQIRVQMWPLPVPMTLQTLAIGLMAMTLGPRLGTISAAFYIIVGVCGGPVFSGGAGGWGALAGHTGGYIIGFLLMPSVFWLVAGGRRDGSGALSLRSTPLSRVAMAIVAAQAVVFVPGVIWLAVVLAITGSSNPIQSALVGGLAVFIPGFIAKSLFLFASARATDSAAFLRW